MKQACRETALKYLNNEIEKTDFKKLKKLRYSKLEARKYLSCNEMSSVPKKVIFKGKIGMLSVAFILGQKSHCFCVKLRMIKIVICLHA